MSTERLFTTFLKGQFKIKNFKVNFENPEVFVTPQFGPKKAFLVWTIFWAALHVIVLGLQPYFLQHTLPNPKWFTLLSNWGYVTMAVFSIVDCAVTVYVFLKEVDFDGQLSLPWYMKIQWVLYNLTNISAISVTVLYYVLLDPGLTLRSTLKHAVNSLYILANLFYSAKPIRLLHFYQGVLYGVVYSIFTLVYQKSGGAPIYSQIDWDKPGNALLFVFGMLLIAIPLVHLVCFTLYSLKFLCCVKIRGAEYNVTQKDSTDVDKTIAQKDLSGVYSVS